MVMQIVTPIEREAFDFDLQIKTVVNQAQAHINTGTSNGSDILEMLFRIRDVLIAGEALHARNPNTYYQGQS